MSRPKALNAAEKAAKNTTKKSSSTPKEWTIMVYLAGDNNLSEEMISALIGMKDAMKIEGSDKSVNLVAVYDSGYPTVFTTHYCFTEANSAQDLSASAVPYIPVRKDLQKKKAPGERAYIIDFVRWVKRDYPATNYALIMSGHSDGIIGRTIFRDSNPDTSMTIRGLEYVLRKCKGYLGKKFALLGFDSCLMNMVEVAYELQNHADIIVGSEGNVPTSGWSYKSILQTPLQAVCDKKGLKAIDLAKSIVLEFTKFSKEYNIGGRSVNISACDTRKLNKVGSSIADLARLFNRFLDAPIESKPESTPRERMSAQSNAVIRERIKELIHRSHYDSQTFMYEQAVDVADFVTILKSHCKMASLELNLLSGATPSKGVAKRFETELSKIESRCDAVISAVDAAIFARGFSGASFQFSTGLSIFFPWTVLAFLMLFSSYKRLKFSQQKIEWLRFICRFTLLTYRPKQLPQFLTADYLTFVAALAESQVKDVGFKDVGFKDVGFKDVGFKDVGFKDVGFKDVGFKDVGFKDVGFKDVGFKDVGFKDVGFKDVGFKDVGFKDVGFKNVSPGGGGDSDFYVYFRRFRNQPIDHDVNDVKIR